MIDCSSIKDIVQELESFLKFVFEEIFGFETNIIELLLVDSVNLGPEFRIQVMEVFFESLRLVSINFVNSAVASLFLSGRTTGTSMELGH